MAIDTFQNQEEGAEIEIYDASSRLVKQYSHPISTRTGKIYWDGKDNYGHKLPAGVYFVRLEAPAHAETRKVALLD